MNRHLVEELLKLLGPVIKSHNKARRLLSRYWREQIALVWWTEDVHHVANQQKVVLTEEQARKILHDVYRGYDAEYGLRWEDFSIAVIDSDLGRPMKPRELKRFLEHGILIIDKRK